MSKKNNLLGSMVESVQSETKKMDSRFDRADEIMLKNIPAKQDIKPTEKSVKVLVTMPPSDRDALNDLVDRALNLRRKVTKSELMRLAISRLSEMTDNQYLDMIDKER
jgi:hypothetical protein